MPGGRPRKYANHAERLAARRMRAHQRRTSDKPPAKRPVSNSAEQITWQLERPQQDQNLPQVDHTLEMDLMAGDVNGEEMPADFIINSDPEICSNLDHEVDFESHLHTIESIPVSDSTTCQQPLSGDGEHFICNSRTHCAVDSSGPEDCQNGSALAQTPLPPTALANTLSVLLMSPNPYRAVVELTDHATPSSHDLIYTSRNFDNNADYSGSLSITEGLEHIVAELGSELPNILANESIQKPDTTFSPEQLQYLYAGLNGAGNNRTQPCIEASKDGLPEHACTSEFDIDSLILFSDRLDVFRRSLLWYPAQISVGAFTSSMHLRPMHVEFYDNHGHLHQKSVPIHHIPNYCFARLAGADQVTIHWVFPHLYTPPNDSVQAGRRLTQERFQHWTDRILIPSIEECLPAGRLQHFPSTCEQAHYNSRAHYVEGRSSSTGNTARQQNIQYEIPDEFFGPIQDAILRRVQEPGNQEFRNAILVVTGKGLKLQPWKTQRWSSTVDRLFAWLDSFFYMNSLNEELVHIDVGVEIFPTTSLTLIWRRDFLERFASCLQACGRDNAKIIPTIYPWGFLRGLCSSTIEIPISSSLRQQGLSYVQHYSSFKEIFAAGNTYPFSNKNLSSLSFSHNVLKVLQYVGKATSVKPETLARAYIHSKLRCHHGIAAATRKAFGCRWECRVTLALLRQIDQSVRRCDRIHMALQISAPGEWVAHETKTVAQWYRFNLNKFCYGFELVYSQCQNHEYVAWEHTRLMLLLLQCITCFTGIFVPGMHPTSTDKEFSLNTLVFVWEWGIKWRIFQTKFFRHKDPFSAIKTRETRAEKVEKTPTVTNFWTIWARRWCSSAALERLACES